MRSRALAIVLVVLMTPTGVEIVEAGFHLVTHGDLGHLTSQREAPPDGDEHGCSALFHFCDGETLCSLPCANATATSVPLPHLVSVAPATDDARGRGQPQPPHRPPIRG